jgi:hypothetical protein
VISGQVVAFLDAEEPAEVASTRDLSSYKWQQCCDYNFPYRYTPIQSSPQSHKAQSSPTRLTTYLTKLSISKVLAWFELFSSCSLEKQVEQCLGQLWQRRTEFMELPLTMTYLSGLQRTHADLLLASLAP